MLLFGLLSCLASKPLPQGRTGSEADALAQKMLSAINATAWDSTGAISWSFVGQNQYLWDRERSYLQANWGNYRVLVNLSNQKGLAFKKGEKLETAETEKLVKKAYERWINDSFWLQAPAKVFASGTSRTLIESEDGKVGLLITYSSGGVTPGDSYLWELDAAEKPQAWRMWVSVLPIKGMRATWENWQTLSTGAKIATTHKMGPVTLRVENLRGARHLEDLLNGAPDPFIELMK